MFNPLRLPHAQLTDSVHEFYFGEVLTETVTPPSDVPIFLIHTIDRPFCAYAACACSCHENQAEVRKLLHLVNEGVLTLREAADTQEGRIL